MRTISLPKSNQRMIRASHRYDFPYSTTNSSFRKGIPFRRLDTEVEGQSNVGQTSSNESNCLLKR